MKRDPAVLGRRRPRGHRGGERRLQKGSPDQRRVEGVAAQTAQQPFADRYAKEPSDRDHPERQGGRQGHAVQQASHQRGAVPQSPRRTAREPQGRTRAHVRPSRSDELWRQAAFGEQAGQAGGQQDCQSGQAEVKYGEPTSRQQRQRDMAHDRVDAGAAMNVRRASNQQRSGQPGHHPAPRSRLPSGQSCGGWLHK